ncbi:MAG: hypothetical protein HKN56_05425 [Gammaproteobacteria bacterium]|nr:VPLPA-CTERM sorting domain-containing protein [Gammaproteobacteria bacterium]NND54396.1 hypothetical protein [Gammaproteobacteria bacterium]
MKNLRCLLGAVALMLVLPVHAGIVTVDGDNVRFTYDDSTLYGTATVVGDSIFFQPTNFRAESLNGAGPVSVSEMLTVRVEVLTAGFWLDEFALLEQGDYFLNGAGASVSAGGSFEVASNLSAFSDSNATSAGALATQGVTTEWTIESNIKLTDTVGWFGDFDVDVSIDNDLIAETLASGEEAWIQKKFGGVGLSVTAVPVPAAAWLFMSALGMMGGLRRLRG